MRLLKKSGKVVCMLLALLLMLGSMTPLLAARVHDAEAERTVRDPGGEREEHMYMEAMQLPIPAPEHVLREHGITLAPEGIFATDDNEYIEAGGRDTSVEMVPAPASVLLEAGIALGLGDRPSVFEGFNTFEDFLSEAGIIFAPEGLLPVADVWQTEVKFQEDIADIKEEDGNLTTEDGYIATEYVPSASSTPDPYGSWMRDDEREVAVENERGTSDINVNTATATVTIIYRSSGQNRGTVPPAHGHNTPTTVTLAHHGDLYKKHHVFVGWRDAAGHVRPAGFTWTQNTGGTITFDAVWVHITNLYLLGNGNTHGTVPPVQRVAVPGVLTLPPPGTMAKHGHMFVGWRCWSGAFRPVGTSWTSGGGGFVFHAEWVPITELHLVGNGHQHGIVPPMQRVEAPGTLTMPQPGTMARPGYRFNGWRCWSGNSLLQPGFSWRSYGGGFLFFAEWVPDTSLPVEIAGFDIITHLTTETMYNGRFLRWPLEGDLLDIAKDSTYLVLVFNTPPGVHADLSWVSQGTGWHRINSNPQVSMQGTMMTINLARTLNQYARFVTTPCPIVFLDLGGMHLPPMPIPTFAFLSNGISW